MTNAVPHHHYHYHYDDHRFIYLTRVKGSGGGGEVVRVSVLKSKTFPDVQIGQELKTILICWIEMLIEDKGLEMAQQKRSL